MEDKTTIRMWHSVFAVSAATLVVVSMVYWLYTATGKAPLGGSGKADRKVEELSEKITELEAENRKLRDTPPQVKVVTKTVEVAEDKECPEIPGTVCTPCPECQPCPQVGMLSSAATQSSVPVPAASPKEGLRHSTLAAVDSVACSTMDVGAWKMPETCRRLLVDFVKQQVNGEKDFFVLTPVVDSRRYKGKQPELKQAGLGQFRIESAKKTLRSLIDPNIPVFSKKVLQKEQTRGFILERYRVVESN